MPQLLRIVYGKSFKRSIKARTPQIFRGILCCAQTIFQETSTGLLTFYSLYHNIRIDLSDMETYEVPAATAATQQRFERMKRRLRGLYEQGSVSVSLVQRRMQTLCMPDASPVLSELTLGTFVSLSTGRAHPSLRSKLLVRTLTLYRLLHAARLA